MRCVPRAQLRSIILINCGGVIDLIDHLQTRLDQEDEGSGAAPRSSDELPHPECRWYILDSHRPYNLNNVIEDTGKAREAADMRRAAHICPSWRPAAGVAHLP